VANGEERSWENFGSAWSFENFGSDFDTWFLTDVLGEKPFTMMYYSQDASPWDAAVLRRVVDVVSEGNEPVGGQRNSVELPDPVALCIVAQWNQTALESFAPGDLFELGEVPFEISDAPVNSLLVLDPRLEYKVEHTGVTSEMPGVGLLPGQLRAIDTRLLPRTPFTYRDLSAAAKRPVALSILSASWL
jgi:hypothetical protein